MEQNQGPRSGKTYAWCIVYKAVKVIPWKTIDLINEVEKFTNLYKNKV